MSYMDKITAIYNDIGHGKAMEAFENYYAENVTMVLEDGTEVKGKDTNREREKEFFASVESFNGLDIISITSNEDQATTAVECVMDVTFNGGNQMDIEQVAVQHWEGDQIIKERFYATQNN